ncbi:MAG: TrmH family RNA methyltransferase [Candidatus Dojkabacteria bacterium]|nr:MAG: TrmH family RNA methyltransferase [Candidatus Dojkabacteria bacterium]
MSFENRGSPKLKPYLKKLDYSYALGIEPTLDLMKHQPDRVMKVLFRDGADENEPGWRDVMKFCVENRIEYEFNYKAIDKISYIKTTSVIGIYHKYQPELDPSHNHVVLVNPMNMGNIGTVMRSMAAFGFHDLAIIRPGVDIFDPKAVRGSMGAFFQHRFEYFEDFEAYSTRFGGHALYPFVLGGSANLVEVGIKSPYALIFGNETNGLGDEYKQVGTPVYIPHSVNVESLNLSVAASVAMFTLYSRAI